MSKKISMKIVGERTMHCGGCEGNVKFTLSQIPGVNEVIADRNTQMVEISLASDDVNPEAMKAALSEIGYQAEVI